MFRNCLFASTIDKDMEVDHYSVLRVPSALQGGDLEGLLSKGLELKGWMTQMHTRSSRGSSCPMKLMAI